MIDYAHLQGTELLVYDENYKARGFYPVQKVIGDVKPCRIIDTTLGSIQLPIDIFIATTNGDKLVSDIEKRDVLIHPYGFRPVVVGFRIERNAPTFTPISEVNGYIQIENCLVRLK